MTEKVPGGGSMGFGKLQKQSQAHQGGDTPPYYLVLDLETKDPPPDEGEIERRFAPTGNMRDPEKIRDKQNGLKMAITDSAPIWAVGMKSENAFISLSQANLTAEEQNFLRLSGWQLYLANSETSLLLLYAMILDSLPDSTHFVAAGKLDQRKSRFRFARHNLPKPQKLFDCPYIDLMRKWQEFTTRDDKPYVKVEEMALKLGIPYENNMDGAAIPGAIQAGNHFDVLLKNYNDCVIEEKIFYRLK
jgi:hypothetical protein